MRIAWTMANNNPVTCAVTDDAVIVTAIEWGHGISVREHDNLVAALLYVANECEAKGTGEWRRVFVGNVEEIAREYAILHTNNVGRQ